MLYDVAMMTAKIAGCLLLVIVARMVQLHMKAQAVLKRLKA